MAENNQNENDNKIGKRFIIPIIVAVLVLVVALSAGLFHDKKPSDEVIEEVTAKEIIEENNEILETVEPVTIPNLTADVISVHGDSQQPVTFTYRIPEDYEKDYEAYIYEHDSGDIVCNLTREGDYFVGTALLSGKPGETIVYNTNLSNYSDYVEITFYEGGHESDVNEIADIAGELEILAAKYEDANGHTKNNDYDKALNYVYKEAEQWLNNGTIKDLYRSSDSVFIVTNAGYKIFYTPSVEGIEGAFSNDNKLEVSCIFPYLGVLSSPLSSGRFADKIKEVASKTDKADIINANVYSGTTIDINDLRDCLKPNSFVVVNTHGGYDPFTGPYLTLTSKPVNVGIVDYLSAFAYYDSIIFDEHLNAYVGPGFFKRNIPDECLKGSVVYLGACHSMQDARLARAIIEKGAEVVLGYTKAVYDSFDFNSFSELVTYLFTSDVANNKKTTYPVVTAVSLTKKKYPADDYKGAELVYMGNKDYTLFDSLERMTTTVELKLENVIMDTTTDERGSVYDFSYTYHGDKDISGHIKPYDYDLFFSDGSKNTYNGYSYTLADIDGDSNDELLLNLESDSHDPIFDMPQFSLHAFEMTDGGFVEISTGWTNNRGLANYAFTVTDNKLYIATYMEGGDLPAGDDIFYMEYTISENKLEYVGFSATTPDNTVFQFN